MREVLPQRRSSETFDIRFWNQKFTCTVGRYPNGLPGEIFIDGGKSGQDVRFTARDAAVILSPALQHGADLATMRHAITRAGNGTAASILGAILDAVTEMHPVATASLGEQEARQ